MSKRVVIVMPYYDRQLQLNRTLHTMSDSAYDNFSVIIVDDCSPQAVVTGDRLFKTSVIRLNNKITTNAAPIYNIGIQEALYQKADVIIIQSPECYHVGDVISRASKVRGNEYLSFGSFRLDAKTTFQKHDIEALIKVPFDYPDKDPGTYGCNMWYNHPQYLPNGFYWCAALTADNMIKLNGLDESFSFGYGQEDGYFVNQTKIMGLEMTITERPFVVHQWHTQKQYSEGMGELVMRNQMIYARLMLENNYRAKHILTNDLRWGETGV